MWKKPPSLTSLLLVSTRWALLLSQLISWLPTLPESCSPLGITGNILILIGFVQVAVFSALRVYATWNRNITLAIIVLALGLVPFGTNLVGVIHTEYGMLPAPIDACWASVNVSDEVNTIFLFTTRGAAVLSDALVLILTWMKTYRQWNHARKAKLKLSLSTCLLRDGTWYFVGLLIVNVAQMTTFNPSAAPLTLVLSTLPPILVSRFMLNLRHASRGSQSDSSTASATIMSDADFRTPSRLTGDMGGVLRHGYDDSVTWVSSQETDTSDGAECENGLSSDIGSSSHIIA